MGYYIDLRFNQAKEVYDKEKLMNRFCDEAGAEHVPVFFASLEPEGNLLYKPAREYIEAGRSVSLLLNMESEKPESITAGLENFFKLKLPFEHTLFDIQLSRPITSKDKEEIFQLYIKANEIIRRGNAKQKITHEEMEFLRTTVRSMYYEICLEISPSRYKYSFQQIQDVFTGLGLKPMVEDLQYALKRLVYQPIGFPIWFDVNDVQIQRGTWAYIRFSWGMDANSMTKSLLDCLTLADKIGCRVCEEGTDHYLTKDNVDDFIKPFLKFGTIAKGLFGTTNSDFDIEAELAASAPENIKPGFITPNEKIPEEILKKLEPLEVRDFDQRVDISLKAGRIFFAMARDGWSLRKIAEHYNEFGNYENMPNCGKDLSDELVANLIKFCNKLSD
jgi:hypothetical protein